jgi:hypothetical protein
MGLIPMYLVMGLILSIGLFPVFFLGLLNEPLKLFTNKIPLSPEVSFQIKDIGYTMMHIGWCATGLIVLASMIFFIRKRIVARNEATPVIRGIASLRSQPTWGCGYVGDTAKMQYTASSYVRTYRKLAEPLLSVFRKKKEIKNIFPVDGWFETHPYDKIEEWLIDAPLKQVKFLFGKFRFLQNGMIQMYTLYGVVFIILVLGLPFLYIAAKTLLQFLNQL